MISTGNSARLLVLENSFQQVEPSDFVLLTLLVVQSVSKGVHRRRGFRYELRPDFLGVASGVQRHEFVVVIQGKDDCDEEFGHVNR